MKPPDRRPRPRPTSSGIDTRASGVGRTEYARRDRAVLRVLVVVEEDAVALLLPPLARRERRARAARPRARARARRAAPRSKLQRALDAHVDVHAARAGGLRPADEAALVEHLARDERDVDGLCRPADARHRVEIDAQLVGMLEVVGAHRVRVQVDAAEVDDPQELRRVAHDDLVAPCGPTGSESVDRLDPVGVLVGRALLEERLARRRRRRSA